jgi:hypothetical protein
LIGPFLLLVMATAVISQGRGWATAADVGFFVVLGGIVLARVADFRGGDRRTATGQPASSHDLRRYVFIMVGLGLVGWILAKAMAHYVVVI